MSGTPFRNTGHRRVNRGLDLRQLLRLTLREHRRQGVAVQLTERDAAIDSVPVTRTAARCLATVRRHALASACTSGGTAARRLDDLPTHHAGYAGPVFK